MKIQVLKLIDQRVQPRLHNVSEEYVMHGRIQRGGGVRTTT